MVSGINYSRDGSSICFDLPIALCRGVGSIKGRVLDKSTGDPLIGANVLVLNTSLGSAADIDGVVIIYNVPAGKQTLKISYLGYKTAAVDVIVPEGGVAQQEFRLSSQAIEGQE